MRSGLALIFTSMFAFVGSGCGNSMNDSSKPLVLTHPSDTETPKASEPEKPKIGFSTQPQAGWVKVEDTADGQNYGKILDQKLMDADVTEIALITVTKVDGAEAKPSTQDVLDLIKKSSIADAKEPGRIKVIRYHYAFVKQNSLDCLSYTQGALDSVARDHAGHAMHVKVVGLTCVHPQNHVYAINIEVSIRYPADVVVPEITTDAQMLFDTVQPLANR